MKDSASSINCGLSDNIVAYMYGELPSPEVSAFESHLADCQTCIDEFAEVSASRYEVYEWRKLEFDPMKTPVISIPYETVSVLDRIRGLWTFSPKLAFGSTALAAAAVLLAFILGPQLLSEKNVAVIDKPNVILPAIPELVPEVAEVKPLIVKGNEEARVSAPEPAKVVPVKASIGRPSNPKPPAVKQIQAQRTIPVRDQPRALPYLNDFPEDIDESLRLAEVFNDIDTE